jgi:superfamily II DNA/RNA helicase
MTDFAPGMRAIIRDEEWVVKKIETNSLGNKSLYCTGVSPLVKDREAIFLADLENIQVVNPAEVKLIADTSPFYKKSLLYLESHWRQQIPTDSNLHIGHQAAMDLMPYQLDPAKLSLQRPRQRILIADTVGLGKTLEAGILMSELIARGKGKRILVVTVKSMMTQFQKEMWNRFTIPLVRLDSGRIQKIRASLPSNYNPFFYYDKTIVSIDTLKRDVEYRTHLENAYWDIIVIDEAQNVAERGDHQAQRSRLAKLLADRSDTMIMLSATPHDGRAKSFASLMNMLDPTAIADPENYTPEDIKGLCIRRFKKDVKDQVSGSFLERKITLERCQASPKEEYAFDIFADMQLEMDLNKSGRTGQLFKTSLEKSLFSSPAACIKSLDERLKKLRKKYADAEIKDIRLLSELKTALEAIAPEDFTRYQKLLSLLRDPEYAWNPIDTGDRIVIFTERIETMKYLAAQLRKDLGLKVDAVQEISGSMSDAEQQQIVEDFGRTESPVRVLVASDVASEGLNLHYLSHRLIHFDIPWSLMVFQQRNGRIDRYGQQKRPDIRYMLIESTNKRIKGDMRIIEILITKEEQALKNIGDPSLLLGKFTIEDEELVVMDAIETGSDADAFTKTLDSSEEEFDPFEALMKAAEEAEEKTETDSKIVTDETLFSDMDYLYQALQYLGQTESHPVEKLSTVSGLDIKLTDDMRRRLKALVPDEAMPQGETLRVSDDKAFCMSEMRNSMRKTMDESAWPTTQYLWKLHPILSWANDKAGLLFKRDEAPVIGLPGKLQDDEAIYIVSGSMPNRKSTPLIDVWFGLLYQGGEYRETLPMTEVVRRSGISNMKIPNTNCITETALTKASALREDVVKQARKVMDEHYRQYQAQMTPKLDEEIEKLASLQEQHKEYQLSLFESERKKSEAERRVDELFDRFADWVKDTLEIQNNPYIRIESVLMGAKQ